MVICCALFYAVGLGGYLYAMDKTLDNILLYFLLHDPAILVGRLGFCFMLLFGLPLILLPCRKAFLQIGPQLKAWRLDTVLAHEFETVDEEQRQHHGAHLVNNRVDFDEADPVLVTDDLAKQHTTMLTYGSNHSEERILCGNVCTESNTEHTDSTMETMLPRIDDNDDADNDDDSDHDNGPLDMA